MKPLIGIPFHISVYICILSYSLIFHCMKVMAKVFPRKPLISSFTSFERETFTVWMKSLVFHSNGCTVFNSKGQITFRVENYDKKCSSEVCLMDVRGRPLVTLRRKRPLLLLGCWYGYRWTNCMQKDEEPWFHVRKCYPICMKNIACQVTAGFDKFWVVKLAHKASFRIVDIQGHVVAEVKQKQSSAGITLGDDVLTLNVEPNVDHSLVMAIVVVYGLINYKL